MEVNKLKILYDAIKPSSEPSIENPTKKDVVSMLNFAVQHMDEFSALEGILKAMIIYKKNET